MRMMSTYCLEGSPRPAGSVLTVQFTLYGADYVALNTADKAASQRAFSTMMKMTKLDIGALQRAYAGT
ncbi:MAG: VOC family protein [Betaproteobacteria bacterium]|nr:VOC family protein [Betaproteobacteria bacterium]